MRLALTQPTPDVAFWHFSATLIVIANVGDWVTNGGKLLAVIRKRLKRSTALALFRCVA